jgi:hypothetical protein
MSENQLSEKDLYCIARQLQSAWYRLEDAPLSCCKYCNYQFECCPPGRKSNLHFREVGKKLSRLTGLEVYSVRPYQDVEEVLFPGSIFVYFPWLLSIYTREMPREKKKRLGAVLAKLIAADPIRNSWKQQGSQVQDCMPEDADNSCTEQ